MTSRTAANRYARALFDVALAERADLQQIASELASFVDLLKKHPEFEKVLFSPAVPAPRKRAAIGEMNSLAGLPPVLAKLLLLLAERDRLIIVREILAAYQQRLMDHQQVVRAEITSAAALPPERLKSIETALARATGRHVILTTDVDPSLVGGIVARVGDMVYDASVVNQLKNLRKRLEAGG